MMAKIPDLSAVREWCRASFQGKGDYASAAEVAALTERVVALENGQETQNSAVPEAADEVDEP